MDMRNSKKNLVAKVAELEKRLNAVYQSGKDGICHVARANYAEREAEANGWIDTAMYDEP